MKISFVHTQNVRNFVAHMKDAEKMNGESALLVFYGQAGRGKTTAARWFTAQEGAAYCRSLMGWTELWMLQDLCFELNIDPIPHRKKACFEAIIETLQARPRTVIIDEADKLSENFLEWIRDLADKSYVPFALMGEKRLKFRMENERRIWSRTVRVMEFGPITVQDILFFAKEAANLNLTAAQAEMLHKNSEGDFRLAARDVRCLEEIIQTNQLEKVNDDTVRLAVKQGLRGS